MSHSAASSKYSGAAFLFGGGELGSLIRKKDWSATSLGAPESWPQSLRTAVRIMLTSRQPMFVWWGEELINLYNDASKDIVGGKHPEALGRPAAQVWREIWDQVGPRAESAIRENEGTYDESLLLIMERDGYPEETYYTFSYSPLPNGEGAVGGILCAAIDDTQRIVGERQLTLLRELAAKTTNEADRRKDEFLAMLAHELRNPLAPIRTGLDLLALTGGDAEILEPMQQQVQHLVRLVDDLLDVSRIMRGKVELRKEPVELSIVISRAVETVRPLIDAADQQLTVSYHSEPVWLNADAVRLAQVISNLLNNSSKYTERGGEIAVTIQHDHEHVEIAVSDTGMGIDRDLLPRVFDLFTQAARTIDRSQGGLGIGLTVVKSLVEMHEGTVTVESQGLQQGSTFTVRLPITVEKQSAVDHYEHSRATPEYRILVVDDNRAAAKMVGLLLKKLGDHQVATAYDGPSAIEAALAHQPDIIVLDIGLPHMDGHAVAEQLRRIPDFAETFVIALTGYGTDEDRRRSLDAGFDEHLVKPPSVEQLRRMLLHPKLAGR